MIDQEMAHQDLGPVERRIASRAGGRWFWLSLVARVEKAANPTRTQEDAAIEAEDVLSQADEALVLG